MHKINIEEKAKQQYIKQTNQLQSMKLKTEREENLALNREYEQSSTNCTITDLISPNLRELVEATLTLVGPQRNPVKGLVKNKKRNRIKKSEKTLNSAGRGARQCLACQCVAPGLQHGRVSRCMVMLSSFLLLFGSRGLVGPLFFLQLISKAFL